MGLFPCYDCLIKATNFNKGVSHAGKRLVQQGVYRAHANGAFEARERFIR